MDLRAEVDIIISRIEAAFTDITTSYTDWLNVGFAFASEFGESGRTFFHRVSRFYTGYTKADTDKQYDQCLRSQGHGITIRTFFHMAKEAGIDCTRERGSEGEMERGDNGAIERACDQYNDSGSNPSTDRSFNPSSFTPSLPHAVAPSSSGVPSEESVPSYPHPLVPSDEEPLQSDEQMPTLPDELFEQLPLFFQKVVAMAVSKEERDILFLGSLVTISSCLSTISGIYDGKKIFANLYLYVTARASAGKGRLVLCRNLVNLIHWEKRRLSNEAIQHYELEMREFNALKSKDLEIEKPEKPPVMMLFIPANNSTTGFFQILSDNDGRGLIFETEGDTIAQSFKIDYSNFSDGFRKAFHHESMSYYRRTDREYVEIECPCVSAVISSTLGQMLSLIPSVENGLASRFMFYFMNIQPVWKNVFANTCDKSLEEHFNQLGREFYSLYNTLKEKEEMTFTLSEGQQQEFNVFFAQVQDKYLELQGVETISIIRRLGLIAFRIMMVLTAIRLGETGNFGPRQECGEEDFHSALAIVKTLVRHASHVFAQLPVEPKPEKRKNKKERFFEGLPEKFDTKTFVDWAKSLDIAERTAYKYIAGFCEKGLIEKIHPNEYIKKKD